MDEIKYSQPHMAANFDYKPKLSDKEEPVWNKATGSFDQKKVTYSPERQMLQDAEASGKTNFSVESLKSEQVVQEMASGRYSDDFVNKVIGQSKEHEKQFRETLATLVTAPNKAYSKDQKANLTKISDDDREDAIKHNDVISKAARKHAELTGDLSHLNTDDDSGNDMKEYFRSTKADNFRKVNAARVISLGGGSKDPNAEEKGIKKLVENMPVESIGRFMTHADQRVKDKIVNYMKSSDTAQKRGDLQSKYRKLARKYDTVIDDRGALASDRAKAREAKARLKAALDKAMQTEDMRKYDAIVLRPAKQMVT
jgi:hypothetical protein